MMLWQVGHCGLMQGMRAQSCCCCRTMSQAPTRGRDTYMHVTYHSLDHSALHTDEFCGNGKTNKILSLYMYKLIVS